jgi:hypothetical protein
LNESYESKLNQKRKIISKQKKEQSRKLIRVIKCPKNNTKNKEKFKKKNRIVLKNDENIGAVTYIKKKNKIEICLNPKKTKNKGLFIMNYIRNGAADHAKRPI